MPEWKTDEFGKRYRMIGNIKEYEMMIRVDGGIEIPESQLAAYNANKVKEERCHVVQESFGRCPFKNGLATACRSDCALFDTKGCKFVIKLLKTDTAGKSCPFSSYKCSKECRLYDGGCTV